MKQQTKTCQSCKQKFTIEPEDFNFYEKIKVPAPTFCLDCRLKCLLQFRNERTLYKRTCDFCGDSMISMYNPNSPYTVYCYKCYQSDKWDPISYQQEVDFSKPFFEQFKKLLLAVPRRNLYINVPTQDTQYTNFSGRNRNCYLIFNSGSNEDCYYSRGLRVSRSTFDTYYAVSTENCYEGVNVHKSYNVRFGQNVFDSIDSWFLLNCSNCQNCFGCVNLRNKQYCFFNEQLSKKEYQGKLYEFQGSYSKIQEAIKLFDKHSLKFPYRESNNIKSVDSIGDYVIKSKNCTNCYETAECEDCKNGFFIKLTKDSQDMIGYGYESQLLFQTVACGYSYNVHFSWSVASSRDIEYGFDLDNCQDCFGCEGLKSAQYSILNKQYSKEDYIKLRNQIINQMKKQGVYGSYFPPELAPFAYNETLAIELFPATKKQVISQGLRWEENIPVTRGLETIKPEKIPDNINDVSDDIVKEVLVCTECGHNYRLIRSEFEFYKRMLIPVPRKCFNCRHLDRVRRRGPFKLYSRICAKCNKSIQTTYAPDKKEIVYCESCYQSEVV